MITHPDLKEGDLVPVPCRHCASVSLSIKVTPSVLRISCPKCGKASEVRVQDGMCGWTVSVKTVSGESAETLERPAGDRRLEPLHGSQPSPEDRSESIIRKALVADVPAIARVHVDSSRMTYRDIVPEELLTKLSYEKREELWKRVITDSWKFTFVAEAAGRIVGFGSGGRNRGGEADYQGELYAVYLLEAQQQRGLGRQLTLAIARELEKAGMRSMIAWILRGNPAREFCKKLGGEPVASKLIIMGGATLEELAYGWSDLATLHRSA